MLSTKKDVIKDTPRLKSTPQLKTNVYVFFGQSSHPFEVTILNFGKWLNDLFDVNTFLLEISFRSKVAR